MSSSSLRMCFVRCILTITLSGLLVACNDESEGDLKRDDVSLEILPGDPNEDGEDIQLLLSWDPNPHTVSGYIVYYGPAEDTTLLVASDLSVTANNFDAGAPSVAYRSWSDLALRRGDSVCFRLRAYNAAGQSGLSDSACVQI